MFLDALHAHTQTDLYLKRREYVYFEVAAIFALLLKAGL
jgi:hypothetical protein